MGKRKIIRLSPLLEEKNYWTDKKTTRNLVDYLRCWLLSQGVHHGAQLLRADGSVAVFVKESEGLPELCCLLVSEMVCHAEVSLAV